MAPTEWREEVCDDCGIERERAWITRGMIKSLPTPKGFRVEARSASSHWKAVSAPTGWVTLCDCNAP